MRKGLTRDFQFGIQLGVVYSNRLNKVFDGASHADSNLIRKLERKPLFACHRRFGCCCGERGRNRTFNLLIKSQLLCQLSYAPESGNQESSGCPRAVTFHFAATLRLYH